MILCFSSFFFFARPCGFMPADVTERYIITVNVSRHYIMSHKMLRAVTCWHVDDTELKGSGRVTGVIDQSETS